MGFFSFFKKDNSKEKEEVLTNLFQMYIQNKIFTDDNILREFISKDSADQYKDVVKFIEKLFETQVDSETSLENATINDIIALFKTDLYEQHLRHDISYILKKHQKISAMKDQMVKDETLKMVCE